MKYHRCLRSMGRTWVPTTMELIQDGIYDPLSATRPLSVAFVGWLNKLPTCSPPQTISVGSVVEMVTSEDCS